MAKKSKIAAKVIACLISLSPILFISVWNANFLQRYQVAFALNAFASRTLVFA